MNIQKFTLKYEIFNFQLIINSNKIRVIKNIRTKEKGKK